MFYVKVKDGLVVTEPRRVSTSTTDSPNTDWKPEQLSIHGFVLLDIENEKVVGGQIVKITAEEKETKRQAEETKREQAKAERKKAKNDFFDLLNVPPPKRAEAAKALRFLIEDGNAD